jgi:hypothetical protein
MFLVHTAMAALEAGLPDEAKSYAEKALAARESPPFLHARPVSFEADSLGAATSLANVVLGRLALPKGDIEDAEQRLLLSVQVNTGFGPFWGPI